jgi:hypothetical protein
MKRHALILKCSMRTETARKSIRTKGIQKTRQKRNVYVISATIIMIVVVIMGLTYFLLHRKPDVGNSNRNDILQNSNQSPDASAQSIVSNAGQIAITKAIFSPEYINGKDILKVVAEAKGPVGMEEEVHMKYEWKINGQDAGSGSDNVTGFKRGDKVSVRVTPYTENLTGHPVMLNLQIANTTPGVFGGKELTNDGKMFSYQINAQDPDGDALSYELLSGPEGMTIDKKSGVVNWPLKENNSGNNPVKVKITDGQGGEITYQLTATIPKKTP